METLVTDERTPRSYALFRSTILGTPECLLAWRITNDALSTWSRISSPSSRMAVAFPSKASATRVFEGSVHVELQGVERTQLGFPDHAVEPATLG